MLKRGPDDFYVVILAGGKGKRLRPLSTDSKPKAFLSVTADRKTMLRRAFERAGRLAAQRNILVAANKKHARLVKKDLPRLDKKNLILEPVSRNTAPAIALASLILEKRRHDAVVAVLPADQYIRNDKKYLDAVKNAIDFVRRSAAAIVTVGVAPKFASTELGYIRISRMKLGLKGIVKAEQFVEKPDLNTAKVYLKSGRYLWNTCTFIFKTETMLDAIRRCALGIAKYADGSTDITKHYAGMPDISIDYAVMEKSDNIYCAKGDFQWKDMGDFKSIKEILKLESRKFIKKNGKVIKVL